MDGSTLGFGAVADVPLIRNPITLARRVMESPHVFLQGEGAVHFAAEHGIAQCRLFDLLTGDQLEAWRAGYKGMYDEQGHLLVGRGDDTYGTDAIDTESK